MKLFETNINGQTVGYVVGKNGTTKIAKVKDIVKVWASNEEVGEYTIVFDTSKLSMYAIG
jgi:hypothetical protein